MNKLNYEILSAIDNIETTVMESEMNVMNSLINSYDKAVMILENCDDNTNVDSFDIFQESVIMEADNNVKESKAKKIIDKIIDLFKLIGRMIKNAYNFIKGKIDKVKRKGKPIVDEKLVEEIKDIVDDDTASIEIIPSISGSSKPEVVVTTASHDTEKEKQIKSKIESAISSTPSYTKSSSPISFGNGNSGTQALSNVSPFKSGVPGNSGTQALSSNIKIEISKENTKFECMDNTKCIEALSILCKKFDELFGHIDIDIHDEHYRECFREKRSELRQ